MVQNDEGFTGALERSRQAVADEVDRRKEQIARLAGELQRLERELLLVEELLRLRRDPEPQKPVTLDGHLALAQPTDGSGPRSEVSDAVIEILRTSGSPIHIQKLYVQALERGIHLPGKGQPANLISVIRSHPAIVRPMRGMYALREWGVDDYAAVPPPGKRRERRQQKPTARQGHARKSPRRSSA
jgi:hypothetical protein